MNISPTLTGRCLLALYKIRWVAFPIVVIAAWLALIVICELRMREDGLRKRMHLAAEMLTNKSMTESTDKLVAVLKENDARIQGSGPEAVEENKRELLGYLKKWNELSEEENPLEELTELSKFLSPKSYGGSEVAPVIVESSIPPKGDYANWGIDVRVNTTGNTKKKEFLDGVQDYIDAEDNWKDDSKNSNWFVSDAVTAWWPADEYRFYDFKRDRLNRMILGGIAASLGILGVLLGSFLGGFDPPSWRQIFREKKFILTGKGRVKAPFNCDIAITRVSNCWLGGILLIVVLIQIRQFLERKELWAEAWINHPASFIVISAFGFALAASCRSLSPSRDKEYFLEDYLNHFRQITFCILCVPVASLIVIVFSLSILMPSDPTRAWWQILIGISFILASVWSFRHMIKSAKKIKCRENRNSDEENPVDLGKYLHLIIFPKLDKSLPFQALCGLGGLLLLLTLGGL